MVLHLTQNKCQTLIITPNFLWPEGPCYSCCNMGSTTLMRRLHYTQTGEGMDRWRDGRAGMLLPEGKALSLKFQMSSPFPSFKSWFEGHLPREASSVTPSNILCAHRTRNTHTLTHSLLLPSCIFLLTLFFSLLTLFIAISSTRMQGPWEQGFLP